MDFEGIELREYERMTDPHIPETLKTFIVDNGLGEKVSVETTDLSNNGIRILIPSGAAGFEKHNVIIISPADGRFKLIGEVVHTMRVTFDTTYMGIKLLKTSSLPHYLELINPLNKD